MEVASFFIWAIIVIPTLFIKEINQMKYDLTNWLPVIEILSIATFALSILFLRQTVLSIIRGGSHTFSMWRHLNDRSRMPFFRKWYLFSYAAFASVFKGKVTNLRQDGGSYRKREDRVVDLSKGLSRATPMDYDSILSGIMSIIWARFCVIFAGITFLLKVAIIILKLFFKA